MHLTPTERKLAALLADGQPHTRREIHALICDSLDPLSNIRQHVCNLRAKLKGQGQDIDCVLLGGHICYRQIVLLTAS